MRPAERRMCIVINGPVSSGKTKLYLGLFKLKTSIISRRNHIS
jgi:Ni2+-binding GTPase involved in maturation of urease and hydrogenase